MTSSASRRVPAFLNVTVPANERYQPSSATSFGELGVAAEAVEHRALGRADPAQGLHDLAVRVAVVDLQGEAVLLGDRDVRLERAELGGAPGLVGVR